MAEEKFPDVRSVKNEIEAPPKTLQTYKPADSSKTLDALNSGFRRKITFRSRGSAPSNSFPGLSASLQKHCLRYGAF